MASSPAQMLADAARLLEAQHPSLDRLRSAQQLTRQARKMRRNDDLDSSDLELLESVVDVMEETVRALEGGGEIPEAPPWENPYADLRSRSQQWRERADELRLGISRRAQLHARALTELADEVDHKAEGEKALGQFRNWRLQHADQFRALADLPADWNRYRRDRLTQRLMEQGLDRDEIDRELDAGSEAMLDEDGAFVRWVVKGERLEPVAEEFDADGRQSRIHIAVHDGMTVRYQWVTHPGVSAA